MQRWGTLTTIKSVLGISLSDKPDTLTTSGAHVPRAENVNVSQTRIPFIALLGSDVYRAFVPRFATDDLAARTNDGSPSLISSNVYSVVSSVEKINEG